MLKVEYFIKDKFEKLGLSQYKEFIHFGLTSQDINNTAIPLSNKEAFERIYAFTNRVSCQIKRIKYRMGKHSICWRTHGQPCLLLA
jgi:adenylosuccinate lyase